MLKRCLTFCILLALLLCLCDLCAADPVATGTPTIYKVTMRKLEASKDGGNTWYTLGEGDMTFDIASADAGAVVGAYASNGSVPLGTYTKMRITSSRTFILRGSVDYLGTTYYTSSGGTTTVAGQLSEQSISVPDPPVPVEGTTFTATDIITVEDRSATPFIVEEGVIKTVTIKFDVTGKLALYDMGGGSYQFMPQQPTVTLTCN
ncbi:MAG: hypothetical protein AB1487_04315 [Thermodesulfobacteriota bacterium]